MKIKAWSNFSKKRNSTKRPTTSGTEISVFLKEDTSIKGPSFILNEPLSEYTYIQAFGHYYFVEDVINLTSSQCEIRCSQDVLATYKDDILNNSAQVLYSSSNYDLNITDSRLSMTNDYEAATAHITESLFNTTGCYIFTCMNGKSNGCGGISSSYALTEEQLTSLSSNILNNQDFFQQLVNEFTNPMDAIISCIWIPISIDKIVGTSESNIFIGTQSTLQAGKHITKRVKSYYSINVPITWPSIASDVTYLRKAPFSTGVLYLPFIGSVPIDLDLIYASSAINVDVEIDILSGDIIYVLDHYGQAISTYSGNIATNIPLSASGYSASGVTTGAISVIGGIAAAIAGGALTGTVAATVGGGLIASTKSTEIHTQINGGISSSIGIAGGDYITTEIITKIPTEDIEAYKDSMGLPCMQYLSLGTLNGYCQCENASIDLNGRARDRDEVNSFLNGGFYIE